MGLRLCGKAETESHSVLRKADEVFGRALPGFDLNDAIESVTRS